MIDTIFRRKQNPTIQPNTDPNMIPLCKHPQVRVVAREDDVEFVECQNCREVFDSAEYLDMAIEEEELHADPLSSPAKENGKTGRKR